MKTHRHAISFSRAPQNIKLVPTKRSNGVTDQATYEQGRRDGEKALQEQLLQQRNDLLALERGVLDSLQQILPRIIQEGEQAMTLLCLEVAQKLVADLPITAEMVSASIQEALDQIQEATEYHIDIHPEDWALLEKFNSPLLQNTSQRQILHFHKSEDMSRGGVQVRTRFGRIDARRETKLEFIQQTLLA